MRMMYPPVNGYHEVDSIKLEMEVRGEEFSIVFNKKQALLIAAAIENYFS